jgi:hypothetical protein
MKVDVNIGANFVVANSVKLPLPNNARLFTLCCKMKFTMFPGIIRTGFVHMLYTVFLSEMASITYLQ